MNLENFDGFTFFSHLSPIWALLIALLLDKYMPIPSAINPIGLFRLLAARMQAKVLKPTQSAQQQTIAGFGAHLLLVLPFIAIVSALYLLAGLPWLLNIVVLWVSLQFGADRVAFKAAAEALMQEKLILARELSQQKLCRETKLLSNMGLSKALVEGFYARYQYQYVSVIFCFVLLGPIAALGYRLSYECSQVWNIKHSQSIHFSRFTQISCRVVQFLPVSLSNILFCLLFSPKVLIEVFGSIKIWRQSLYQPAEVIRRILSLVINKNTGGPVFYNSQKVPRHRFYALSQSEPTPKDVNTLQNKLNIHLSVLILSASFVIYLL